MELHQYLSEKNKSSSFQASQSEIGGNITFSNSGKRGSVKEFTLGLDSFIKTFKDIKTHISDFSAIMNYDETSWRDTCSEHFTDGPANAMSTVQTKALFSTLSKIAAWANIPALEDINTDQHFAITPDNIDNTIQQLEKLAQDYIPIQKTIVPKQNPNNAQPLNLILYGPPGTGKTHNTISHALSITSGYNLAELLEKEKLEPFSRQQHKKEFDKLIKEGLIQFVTFHQSYSYEEFIEGIQAKVDEKGNVYYKIENGVFKNLCLTALREFAQDNFDEIYEKFYEDVMASGNSLALTSVDQGKPFTLNAEPTGSFTAKPDTDLSTPFTISKENLKRYILQGKLKHYPTYVKATGEHIKSHYPLQTKMSSENPKNYVLIIDEINRGNISKIFGELITLLEESKRIAQPEELKIKLTYSGTDEDAELFGVPSNVYIIGTMNSTDKSIALIDTALRRRFTFIEYNADVSLIKEDVDGINLRLLLDIINQRIEYLLDRDHLIGHSYFINVDTKVKLAITFKNKILPLLQEYFYNDFQKIQYVLGDNSGWKSNDKLKIITEKTSVTSSSLFGTDIDGYDGKIIYEQREDLKNEKYNDIPANVFKSIYDKSVTAVND